MTYDPNLADRLSALATEAFDGEVFRATRENADPTAPSLTGGRWARPQNSDPGTNVLYTSMHRDGAMAEVASFLADQTPIPGPRKIKVTRLAVTTSKTLRLARTDLVALGVDMSRYGERDYARTQEIGSTLAWLGLDGLIAPSARWECDNLMIFTDNHTLGEKLEPINDELIEWRAWAQEHGIIKAGER
ncbi:MAG: RES family NAD+ phosphorylase [Pseudomonadota bacterium]